MEAGDTQCRANASVLWKFYASELLPGFHAIERVMDDALVRRTLSIIVERTKQFEPIQGTIAAEEIHVDGWKEAIPQKEK